MPVLKKGKQSFSFFGLYRLLSCFLALSLLYSLSWHLLFVSSGNKDVHLSNHLQKLLPAAQRSVFSAMLQNKSTALSGMTSSASKTTGHCALLCSGLGLEAVFFEITNLRCPAFITPKKTGRGVVSPSVQVYVFFD